VDTSTTSAPERRTAAPTVRGAGRLAGVAQFGRQPLQRGGQRRVVGRGDRDDHVVG
jgi:hypothetical protein